MTEEQLEDLQDDPPVQDPPAEDPPADDPPADEPPADDPERLELEDTAKQFGWRPKDKFTRDPEGWVDAERFLQMPLVQVRMLNKTKEGLEKQLSERDEEFSRLRAMTSTVVERTRAQEQERYKAQMAEIESRQRKAVEDADTDTFDALARQKQEIQPPQMPVERPASGPHPDIAAYSDTDEGAWLKDPAAYRYAGALIEKSDTAKLLPPVKQAQWAAVRMGDVFPEYFASRPEQAAFASQKQRAQDKSARVDEGGMGGARRGRSSADLPSEAREVGREWVKEGLFKDLEEYAKDYFGQGAKQ